MMSCDVIPETASGRFNKSGLAALSDVRCDTWRKLYSQLETQQAEFLAHEHMFRSPAYKWPSDTLHSWSRVWEYPYAYHHLSSWRAQCRTPSGLVVADVGSGVTFFPFAVAQLGYSVICTDIDPICGLDLARAREIVQPRPGFVEFRLSDGQHLPFRDRECDAVYCISVLEHIPNFDLTIREVARILKPEGLLVLTVDIDLQGHDLGVWELDSLLAALQQSFEFVFPEVTVHPADILLTTTGPCPMYSTRSRSTLNHMFRQEVKKLLGRPERPQFPYNLAVAGFVLRRKSLRLTGPAGPTSTRSL
jgi:SAM-dependent methyltransferase